MRAALIGRTVVVASYLIAVLLHQPTDLTSVAAASGVLAVWTVALIRDRGRLRKPFRVPLDGA